MTVEFHRLFPSRSSLCNQMVACQAVGDMRSLRSGRRVAKGRAASTPEPSGPRFPKHDRALDLPQPELLVQATLSDPHPQLDVAGYAEMAGRGAVIDRTAESGGDLLMVQNIADRDAVSKVLPGHHVAPARPPSAVWRPALVQRVVRRSEKRRRGSR
jgi:hypothetical protein